VTSGGVLVAFEGGDASGKSTQAAVLARRLEAVLTREPGGTALGERIRALVLDVEAGAMVARAEGLLLAAARAQHLEEVIRPALAAGRVVVSDRFSASSLAYQGYGRGLDIAELRCLSSWATAGLSADLAILLDLPAEVAAQRMAGSPVLDRLEAESREFHDRVAGGYRQLAAAEPDRWVVVDGVGTVEEVAERVWAAWTRWCRLGGVTSGADAP
jgi:dTMP kinase